MNDLITLHLTWLAAGGRAKRTIHDRGRLLAHADRNLPYGIDQAHPDEWAVYLANPTWSAWTRYTYEQHVRGFYTWAVAAGELTLNPLDHLPRPPEGDRLPRPVTNDQLVVALALAPHMPWRMAIMLAAFAALRCCEMVILRRQDCTEQYLRVRRKGGRLATVAMAPVLWQEIEPRPSGLLVTGARGGALTAQRLTQMQTDVWRRLGLDVTLHQFRHWFATRLLNAGVTIRTVQDLMDHRSIVSTQAYTAVTDAQRTAAVALLEIPTPGAPASS